MTRDQAAIAVPILNSYAHQYLGMSPDRILVAAGNGPNGWVLIVATDGDVKPAADLDAAKSMIDALQPGGAA
jgi:hypothetical protein